MAPSPPIRRRMLLNHHNLVFLIIRHDPRRRSPTMSPLLHRRRRRRLNNNRTTRCRRPAHALPDPHLLRRNHPRPRTAMFTVAMPALGPLPPHRDDRRGARVYRRRRGLDRPAKVEAGVDHPQDEQEPCDGAEGDAYDRTGAEARPTAVRGGNDDDAVRGGLARKEGHLVLSLSLSRARLMSEKLGMRRDFLMAYGPWRDG
ncbi:hypothetical protein JMJ77_0014235 [Colletotrichum scovillei]|uniref:Uncharacterized protein n=1 Tax=Colletotrichum scovillei TaxID=1209932 RepID=A0A9P7R4Z0_9PEZI|nr:hypothetical protein JMJ77_0014235 [Colletotrichum scovillei]KAG7065759.1 hypothetical protein JMJ78_0012507 [Colletotrichum scovillei]KAG7068365.1 hypothetical protein JMJ76_0008055 [Colletotrichum scovillei]